VLARGGPAREAAAIARERTRDQLLAAVVRTEEKRVLERSRRAHRAVGRVLEERPNV
jgi:hypothetical protein